MRKRLVDTSIWKNQRWFRKLSPIYKLAFLYIKDQCDHSGVWKISVLDLMDDLGVDEFDINSFIDAANRDYEPLKGAVRGRERLLTPSEGLLWVTGYLQFHYVGKDGKIPLTNVSVSAFYLLESYNLLEIAVRRGYVAVDSPIEGLRAAIYKYKEKYNTTLHNLPNNKVKLYADDISKNGNGSTNGTSGEYAAFERLARPKPENK